MGEVDRKVEDIRRKLNSKSLSEFEILFHKKTYELRSLYINGYRRKKNKF